MEIEYILNNHLTTSISFGLLIGGSIFLLGLGIKYCLTLFNS